MSLAFTILVTRKPTQHCFTDEESEASCAVKARSQVLGFPLSHDSPSEKLVKGQFNHEQISQQVLPCARKDIFHPAQYCVPVCVICRKMEIQADTQPRVFKCFEMYVLTD